MRFLYPAVALLTIVIAACGDDDDAGRILDPASPTEAEVEATSAEATDTAEEATSEEATAEATASATEEAVAQPSPSAHIIGEDGRGLYVYETADGGLEQFAGSDVLGERAVGMDWFPAGDGIASFGSNLVATSTLSGDSETLHEPTDLVFGTSVSPDGALIAFTCSGLEGFGACVIAATGGEATRLTNSQDNVVGWLDDQNILLISQAGEGGLTPIMRGHNPEVGSYFVVNAVSGEVRPATEADVSDPFLSPEGLWRFVAEKEGEEVSVRLEDGGTINIPVDATDFSTVNPEFIHTEFAVAWSNGDVWAAVVEHHVTELEGGVGRSTYKIWLVDLNAQTVELIVETEPCLVDLDCALHADFSTDASQLALLFGIAGD